MTIVSYFFHLAYPFILFFMREPCTASTHCSVCGAVITAQETVDAKGHTEVADEAVAATCTETGLTEGSHCSVCGEVLTAQQTVAAKGHTAVTDEAVRLPAPKPA